MKKIFYSLVLLFSAFICINKVSAEDSIVYNYKIDCSKFISSSSGATPVSQYTNIYVKLNSEGKRYIQINDKNIPIGTKDESLLNPVLCKYNGQADLKVNVEPLLEKIEDVGSKPLYIVGVPKENDGKTYLSFYTLPSAWYKIDGEDIFVNTASQSSYEAIWNSSLWQNGKVLTYKSFDRIDERVLVSTCKFDVHGGQVAVNYYSNSEYEILPTINLGSELVSGDFKGSKDPLQGNLRENIKKGICPKNVYMCNYIDKGPYSDLKKYYLSDDASDGNCKQIEISEEESILQYYQALINPLSALAPEALKNMVFIQDSERELSNVTPNDSICSSAKCEENAKYYTEKALTEITKFCVSNASKSEVKKHECESYYSLYKKLVEDGIISNLAEGCGFLSNDLKDKLNFFLNIIKIAGPILAVVLGMLDFVNVITSGDADKEMKQAGKRFKNRLIAAVLLFLAPVLLSTVINIFIGDEIDNNPYCGLLENSNSNNSGGSGSTSNRVDNSPNFSEDYIN